MKYTTSLHSTDKLKRTTQIWVVMSYQYEISRHVDCFLRLSANLLEL